MDDDAATITTNKRDARSTAGSSRGGGDSDERRRARAARKLKESYATLGLDENGQPLDNFSLLKYPVRECKFNLPGCANDPVAMNPAVTLLAIVCLWSIVVWATVNPVGSSTRLMTLSDSLTLNFLWFYQLSKVIMFFFVIFLTYRYGHVHLGRKKDKPEYSTFTYFSMTFAANVGASFLANASAEPHYLQSGHFYSNAGYRSIDEVDMFAVNSIVSNWGIGSWIGITIVAVCMALAGFRFNLPMTFRSCFYPILGTYTWGWMGDSIDTLALVAGTSCMCAMLNAASLLFTAALLHLGLVEGTNAQELLPVQSVTIWIITIISSLSVISGLRGGIQYIPMVAVTLGLVLTFWIFISEDSKFLLNLTMQEIGYFLQNSVFQLNFWTDAFGQLREGSGRAVDGKAAEPWWTATWPVSYQAWGTCLAPIIGCFVAYISRGRKLWEVVVGSFVAPISALLIWSCIFSGVSLRQARQAAELMLLGEISFNNSAHFLADGSDICYEVPQEDVVKDGEVIFTNHLLGVTPVCGYNPDDPSAMIYSTFESLSGNGLSTMMSLIYLLACMAFYVSHSDSTTFIVDTLASNGRKNYHWSRRMFWSATLAALSTAQVPFRALGASDAIDAFVFLTSFPVAVLLCFLMQSILLLCQSADCLPDTDDDTEYTFPEQAVFSMPVYGGVFNVIEYVVSLGKVIPARVELGMHLPSRNETIEFAVGLVVPFVSLYKVLSSEYPHNSKTNAVLATCYAVCFLGSIALVLASIAQPGLTGVSIAVFLVAGGILGMIRSAFRARHNIRSHTFADFMCATVMWPQVLAQIHLFRTGEQSMKIASQNIKRASDGDSDEEGC